MTKTRYGWILFDLDGTLFDYEDAERQALIGTWRALGAEAPSGLRQAYRRINGELWVDFENGRITQERLRLLRFERLAEELELDVPAETLSDTYVQHLGRRGKLLDGALEVLQALSGRVEMALITNGIPEVQWSRLEQSAIRDFFAVVVISGEVGAAKPAPEIFDEAFRRMGQPSKQDVIIVGDNFGSDIAGGAAYGIDTCWFNPAGHPAPEDPKADFEIRGLAELPAVLGVASAGGLPAV